MPNHDEWSHPWSVRTLGLLMSTNLIKKVHENLFLMFERGETLNWAKTHLPSMSVFSAIFVLKGSWYSLSLGQISELGRSCKLGSRPCWKNPSPLTRGIYFLIHVHDDKKIQGLDLEKITSCQNVFNSLASFQSLPKINCMFITRSFAYTEGRHGSYPQFPCFLNSWDPPFCNEPTKKKWLQF